jgi:Ca2+/H+ antiporter
VSALGSLGLLLVALAPESLAAVRNARRDRVQTSFNLAYGSAMASIGLTIPAIAVASSGEELQTPDGNVREDPVSHGSAQQAPRPG